MPKLTEEQALAGLRQVWDVICDHPGHTADIVADENVVDRFHRDVTDSIGELSLYCEVIARFDGCITERELKAWFDGGMGPKFEANRELWELDVKPTLTFGRFARWIAERCNGPSFEPFNVAGRKCGPAGAFRGIEETVNATVPGRRFPPRASILSRLRRRQLEDVWNRLNVYAAGQLPGLDFPDRRAGDAILLAAILLGFIATMILGITKQFVWLGPALIVCVALGVCGAKLRYRGDPLPPNIKTFRDLAYAMSEIINGPEPAGAVDRRNATLR